MTGPFPVFPSTPSIGDTFTDPSGGVWAYGSAGWYKTVVELNAKYPIKDLGEGSPTFTGTVKIPSGTAAAPSLTFTDDLNTGIYRPGADQVAVATNGTGRLFVDASGRVGIGVSPTQQLELGGSGNIRVPDGATFFSGGDLFIRSGTSGRLRFGSNDSNDRMTLDTSGNLGIGTGTSAIGAKLEVNAAASSSPVIFKINSSEVARIDSSGRLGVGTSTPSHRLHVVGGNGAGNTTIGCYGGSSAGDYGLLILGTGSTDKASVNVDATTNDLRIDLRGNTGAFTFVSGPSYTERMRLDSSGRLGIGDNGPDSTLTIKAAAATTPLRVSGPSSEFLRCDQQGRLLVGTSTDSGGSKLQINDNRIRIATAKTPASATDTGASGEICWDANYVYVCTATNTWKRTALATW